MIDLTLDMEQYDCPFIAATEAQPVSFSAVNWEFDDGRAERLETRMLVEGDDRAAVEAGLDVLQSHDGVHECGLISKQADVAHVRTVRDPVDEAEVTGFVENVGAAMTLIQGCQDLTTAERETLEAAVERGYFRSPRGATLGDLAEEFGVSKPAVSKRLRWGQEKAVGRMVEAMAELDE